MPFISYINERDVNNYKGLKEVEKLGTVEDVATIIETFEDVKRSVGFERIKTVLEDDEKYYYFVISDRKEEFDLYQFINNTITIKVKVSCFNAKSLFPKKASRGIYQGEVANNGVFDGGSDQDAPTEFLDEGESSQEIKGMILHDKVNGTYTDIPVGGLIIGRSSSRVDYIVKDNTNIGRVHCKLYFGDKGYLMVHDCDSLNGTFVNNRRVHSGKDVSIHDRDILSLANVDFEILSKQ